MAAATTYLDESWLASELLPESVPHLLHWDLAYLWVLAREPQLRPESWRARAAGWESLLKLFLAGRLNVHTEELVQPLRQYTEPYGITKIQKLMLDGAPVGILSPVVLVRPLPDATDGELNALPVLHDAEVTAAAHCLELLKNTLEKLIEGGGESADRSLQVTLRKVLLGLKWGSAVQQRATQQQWSLLRSIGFAKAEAAADTVPIFLYDREGPQTRTYVPRCSACAGLLTTPDRPEHAVEVAGEFIELRCPLGHANDIPLERLFLWRRQTGKYVHWTDRQSAFPSVMQSVEWPPLPDIAEGQLRYRWNPGLLNGEMNRTCLRLRFPNAELQQASMAADALYKKLLIPGGDPVRHKGLPVAWEWRDAWAGGDIQADPHQVRYANVAWRGIPFRFLLSFTELKLRRDADLCAGIYPKPMHAAWKPYRAVALSPAAGYAVRLHSAAGELPFVKDVEGWPSWVAVEAPEERCGSTWKIDGHAPRQQEHARSQLRVGIDFGTSSSVLYFSADANPIDTNRNALQPGDFRKEMFWLNGEPGKAHESWFFPTESGGAHDPCLVPTAMWMITPEEGYIRWAGSPKEKASLTHGFKWDDGLQNRTAQRVRYLKEVLFFGLPAMLGRLGARDACPSLDLAFAYPLAFEDSQRTGFAAAIRKVKGWCIDSLGFQTQIYSINESLAAVRAFGTPDPGELFLVADMGGRTLDVSLFSYRAPQGAGEQHHQIGSLDFGGELYLERVARLISGSDYGERHEKQYWTVRDAFASGRAGQTYGHNQQLELSLDRFQTLALEFIRTMLEAHRKNEGAPEPPAGRRVRLMLIGNGWRLRDLTAGGVNPDTHFNDYCRRMVQAFGLPDVEVKSPQLSGIHRSKHWVAVGALKCAQTHQADELGVSDRNPAAMDPSRLPAGRALQIEGKSLAWYTVVGSGGHTFENEQAAKTGSIRCSLDDGPETPGQWDQRLAQALQGAEPYPAEEILREEIVKCVKHSRLSRGPLQLILERHWRNCL